MSASNSSLTNSLELTEANRTALLKQGGNAKFASETAVRDAYLSFLEIKAILLDYDMDARPHYVPFDTMLFTISQSIEFWKCLD